MCCPMEVKVPTRGNNHSLYKANEIDFLVVYIVPRNIWYVIPVSCITALSSLAFYPDGCHWTGGYFEAYREAWHLLAGDTSSASAQPK